MDLILIAAYVATVPLANWLVQHFGTVCIPGGPCLVPVGFGLTAPSGVLVIGAALLLRDLLQRRRGVIVGLLCIAAGCIASLAVAPPALALASTAAFAISELADFAVYTPLARRSFALAVLASCSVGAMADSAAFLWLAFGSLDHLDGQILGKLYAAAAFVAVRAGLSFARENGA